MKSRTFTLAVCLLAVSASAAVAQTRRPAPAKPKRDLLRISLNVGQQATEAPFKQTLTFTQYLEQGDVTLERTIGKGLFVDGGAMLRISGQLYAGATVSSFMSEGSGTLTAHVPHPLAFNQPRTTTGDVAGSDRRETATHIQASWVIPTAHGLEFAPFGGPTIFQAEQTFITALNVVLANEVYPYDTLAFPGVATETIKDTITGYNVGVDMTWRFSKQIGLGAIIRYSHGTKDFTPTGGQATKVEVGGLHAGGGLRLIF
jgi:opacity protein-like surface antigen